MKQIDIHFFGCMILAFEGIRRKTATRQQALGIALPVQAWDSPGIIELYWELKVWHDMTCVFILYAYLCCQLIAHRLLHAAGSKGYGWIL